MVNPWRSPNFSFVAGSNTSLSTSSLGDRKEFLMPTSGLSYSAPAPPASPLMGGTPLALLILPIYKHRTHLQQMPFMAPSHDFSAIAPRSPETAPHDIHDTRPLASVCWVFPSAYL